MAKKKKVKSECALKMKKSFQAGMSIGQNMKKRTPKKKK